MNQLAIDALKALILLILITLTCGSIICLGIHNPEKALATAVGFLIALVFGGCWFALYLLVKHSR